MTMSPRTVTITRRAIKCRLLFTSAAYIQIHLKLDFIMEENTMNPDQTAPKVHIVCNMGYPRTEADERGRRQNLLGVTRTMAVTMSPRTVIITRRAIMIPRQFL